MKSKEIKALRKKFTKVDRIGNPLTEGNPVDLPSVFEDDDTLSLEYVKGPSAPVDRLLDLFERNMGDFYRQSSWGLDLEEKADHLSHRRAHHLVVRSTNNSQEMAAYCHYQYDYDNDDCPERVVLYVYEVQIEEAYRRKRIGTKLMECMERLAVAANLGSILLTVFFANKGAISFYEKLGYVVDESSPSQHGENADYEILIKKVPVATKQK